MKSQNICKFPTEVSPDKLNIVNFIYELNIKTMNRETVLSENRVILIKSGSGTISFGGVAYSVIPGVLIFGFSGEAMLGKCNEGTEYMYISFSGPRANSLLRQFGINPNTRYHTGFDGIIPIWYDSLLRARKISISLAAESMLLYTFSRFVGIAADKTDLLNRIIDLTENNFQDPNLSVTQIAAELNYNPKYISHFFKENMKRSYSEYLRTLRMKYAVSLFDHGLDSVKNIAFMSGFSDPLYFSTVFKKVTGISPKEYKSRVKK